jgi:dihydrodipicolinate reductase
MASAGTSAAKTHNRIDNILTDRRRHSNVLDVRSFRGADCVTDHSLVLANSRERLAVNKQTNAKI